MSASSSTRRSAPPWMPTLRRSGARVVATQDGHVETATIRAETGLSQSKLAAALGRLQDAGAVETLPTGAVAATDALPDDPAALAQKAAATAMGTGAQSCAPTVAPPTCGTCDTCDARAMRSPLPRQQPRRARRMGRGDRAAPRTGRPHGPLRSRRLQDACGQPRPRARPADAGGVDASPLLHADRSGRLVGRTIAPYSGPRPLRSR